MIALRPLSSSDAGELFRLLAGSNVVDTLVYDEPESEAELETSLESRQEMAEAGLLRSFTILELATGAVIGSIRLKYDLRLERGEIGLWLGREFQGRGYGSEAIGQVTEQGFRDLGLKRIEAQIFVGNAASRKAFENNGFALERTERSAILKQGRYQDVWYLSAYRQPNF